MSTEDRTDQRDDFSVSCWREELKPGTPMTEEGNSTDRWGPPLTLNAVDPVTVLTLGIFNSVQCLDLSVRMGV